MEKIDIIKNITERTGGDIYLGVVGAVRTGKSTFIKRFIENLVVPNVEDEYERKRTLDEIPQSAQGKTIMTTEPKFVPSNAAKIKIDDFSADVRLVDCVGYVIEGAKGYEDENGPRMVHTPWYEESIPFVEAAEIGTEKVIKDHSSIGVLVTTDGSIGEFERSNYVEAEKRIASELKEIGKPFIVIVNSTHPMLPETENLAEKLRDEYEAPVIPMNIDNMSERDAYNILREALYEFPVVCIDVEMADWVACLEPNNWLKKSYIETIRNYCLAKKGTTEGFPFGEDILVFKVMGKMVACIWLENPEWITLKCEPEYAIELREHHPGIEGAYHFNKRHWNQVSLRGDISDRLILQLIDHSYEEVIKKFNRKTRNEYENIA